MSFDKRTWAVSYVFLGSYITLTVSYFVIILYLISTLKRMREFGDFSEQHCDILKQFLCFLVSFIAKLTL